MNMNCEATPPTVTVMPGVPMVPIHTEGLSVFVMLLSVVILQISMSAPLSLHHVILMPYV